MERFSRVAQEWWNPDGPYAMLLRMNPVRVGYIRNTIPNTNPQFPFKDLKILDIGCGGGFLSQSLRRLGAQVTAVDANYENVQVAKAYDKSGIEFIHGTAEDLVEQDLKFDAVCGLEIVEHVTNPKEFVKTCSEICKPGGHLFFSTINRTPISFVGTIVIAEHLLEWVPKGTHSFEKYVTPEELRQYVESANATVQNVSGMNYDPFGKKWILDEGPCSVQMNYILAAQKHFE